MGNDVKNDCVCAKCKSRKNYPKCHSAYGKTNAFPSAYSCRNFDVLNSEKRKCIHGLDGICNNEDFHECETCIARSTCDCERPEAIERCLAGWKKYIDEHKKNQKNA